MDNNTYLTEPQPEQGLLDDLSPSLVQAGSGKRLANYLIDLFLFYVLFVGVSLVILLLNPASLDSASDDGFDLLGQLMFLLFYGLYMGLMEVIFKGRSLGKLITGTRAVNEDGSNISAGTAFLRGLSRAVPFNAFSALGSPPYPWHDRWNKTFVVDIKQSGLQ